MSAVNLAELFGNKNYFVDKPIAHMHSFYLSGEITEPENYIDWFEKIRTAGSNDVIRIHINSRGGDLMTAIQFMQVMAETEAHIIASVEGACMSAATLIFLCADSYEVHEHSMFMFHNYSGGSFGKGGEMYDELSYMKKWSDNFFGKTYKDFLTKEEIDTMFLGKDIYMTGVEVAERLDLLSKDTDSETEVEKEPTSEPSNAPTEASLNEVKDSPSVQKKTARKPRIKPEKTSENT